MSHMVDATAEEDIKYDANPMMGRLSTSSVSSKDAPSSRKTFDSRSSAAQARRIAVKATARFEKRVGGVNTGKMGLWNLREAINLHYRRHILLLLFSVGYSVCYSMVVVAEIRDELKDLRQRVSINPGNLDCSQVAP